MKGNNSIVFRVFLVFLATLNGKRCFVDLLKLLLLQKLDLVDLLRLSQNDSEKVEKC